MTVAEAKENYKDVVERSVVFAYTLGKSREFLYVSESKTLY